MPAFWRRLIVLLALAGLGYWYAETYGVYAGFPPFTPVLLWDYTGERVYEVTLRGTTDALKIRLRGELKQGALRVWISRGGRRVTRPRVFKARFEEELRRRLEPGRYTLHFAYEDARGWARLDWVSTKFETW